MVTYDIKFYEVILGVLIEDPVMLLPDNAIPLNTLLEFWTNLPCCSEDRKGQ